MQIDEIIEPEAEYAHELANRIMVKGAIKSMELHGDYEIVSENSKKVIGKTLGRLDIKTKHKAHIITVIKQTAKPNYLGTPTMQKSIWCTTLCLPI